MSTLDQAFIRAYQAGGPRGGTAPAERPPSPQAASTATASAPPHRLAAAASESGTHRREFVDDAHLVGPSPHFVRRSPEADVVAVPTMHRDYASTVVVDPSLVESQAEAFTPAYETQRFAWPRNVEVLIAAAGSEFARYMNDFEQSVRSGRQTLAVTGCERGEGRTTLLLGLARLAANRNLRTVVVDLDLHAPSLAEQLGVRPELGWDDVYAERLPPTDALIESIDDRITLLPLRHAPANPRAMAGNQVFGEIMLQLRAHFDAVLLDVGPLADDRRAIDLAAALTGCHLDAALVVRDRRRTQPKQVQAVCRRLSVLGVHHWDVAENFTEFDAC